MARGDRRRELPVSFPSMWPWCGLLIVGTCLVTEDGAGTWGRHWGTEALALSLAGARARPKDAWQ